MRIGKAILTFRVGRRVSHQGQIQNGGDRPHKRARPGGKLTIDRRDRGPHRSSYDADGRRIRIRGYHA